MKHFHRVQTSNLWRVLYEHYLYVIFLKALRKACGVFLSVICTLCYLSCIACTVFPVIVAAVPIILLVKFSPKIGYMYHISRNNNRRSTEVTIIIFLVKNWPAVTITGAVIIQLRLLLREIRYQYQSLYSVKYCYLDTKTSLTLVSSIS